MDRIQLVTSLGKKLQLYFLSSLIESTSFNKDKQQTTVILTLPVIFVTNRNNRYCYITLLLLLYAHYYYFKIMVVVGPAIRSCKFMHS